MTDATLSRHTRRVLAALLISWIAWAPADTFELAWQAPAACPPAAALRDETARLLARDPGEGGERLSAAVSIEAETQGFSLTLEVTTPSGHTRKELRADRCETLVDAAALVVAVAVDPMAALAAPPRAPESAGEGDDANVSAPPPAPPPRPVPARTRTYLGLAAGVEALALPGVGPGLSVSFGVRPSLPLRGEVFATAWLPRREHFDYGGASMWLWTAGLRLCAQPRLARVELPICVAGEGGQMRGVGLALARGDEAAEPWAALLVGPGVEWPVHRRVRLVGAVDLVVALVRPGFSIEGLGLVHRAQSVAVRGLLGLEFTLSGAEARR